jgi:hypothetical protein
MIMIYNHIKKIYISKNKKKEYILQEIIISDK